MMQKIIARLGWGVALLALLIVAPAARGTITFQFDYTYDTSNFFADNPEAKVDLQDAANFYSSLLGNQLGVIDPTAQSAIDSSTDTWITDAFNPSDPNNTSSDIQLSNVVVPANTIIIYVGGTALGVGDLGIGGPAQFTASGTQTWKNIVEGRGQAGATGDPSFQSNFSPWGGSISFDSTTNWYFDPDPSTTADIPKADYDFYSVALHEMGHILGIGTADSWYNLISNNNIFHGPAATLANNGHSPAVTPDFGHWAENLKSTAFGTKTVQEVSMDPAITFGVRKYFTTLDAAALVDIGWQIADPTQTTGPADQSDTAGKSVKFSVSSTGSAVLKYQWQVSTDGGNNYSNIANGKGITGATTDQLSVATTANSTAGNGNLYRCVVTSPFSATPTEAATLTVNTLPKITDQTGNVTALMGNTANFTVAATGSGTLAYQWQRSSNGVAWSNLTNSGGTSGVATAMLTVTAESKGFYRCVVSNGAGTAESTKTELTVSLPPGGIYFGTLTGPNGAGKFAALVESNQDTQLLVSDTTHKFGFLKTDFTLDNSGGYLFNGLIEGSPSTINLNFTNSTVSGVFVTTTNVTHTSTVKGIRQADTGAKAGSAGYYTGFYSGATSGTNAAILAANGAILIYTLPNDLGEPSDSGTGTIAATNNFSITTVGGTKLTGTLNSLTNEMIGTWKSKSGQTGTFNLTFSIAP